MMSLSVLSLLVASSCGGGVDAQVGSDKRLDVEAKNVPVSRVLECLSERAGFKIVIEPGLATTRPVTISLSRRTPTQAVMGVLDGLLLNYAFTSDRTGFQVLMLLISGRAASAPIAGPLSAGSSAGLPGSASYPRAAPAESEVELPAEPANEPPNVSVPGSAPPVFVPFPPGQPPRYPEARPLSPRTLRDAQRIHIVDARFSRSPGTAADSSSNRERR